MPSLELFSFRGADDVARFQVTTDRVLGGRSTCSFSLKSYANFTTGCFTGTIDYEDENPSSRGGFASFRTRPEERVRDVTAFEAFELRIKTDGRPYTANFKCATHSVDQLWQARLETPAFKWTTVAVPVRDLVLTKRGRVEAHQVALDRGSLAGFGVLLADGKNGPFRFEVQHVRALRSLDPSQWQSHAERLAAEPGGRLAIGDAPLTRPGATYVDHLAGDSQDMADGEWVQLRTPPAVPEPPPNASKEELLAYYRAQNAAARPKTNNNN